MNINHATRIATTYAPCFSLFHCANCKMLKNVEYLYLIYIYKFIFHKYQWLFYQFVSSIRSLNNNNINSYLLC